MTTTAPEIDFLKQLNIDSSAFDLISDSPEEFVSTGRFFTLQEGIKVPFVGTINGQEYETFYTLTSARLTRLSLLDHAVASDANRQSQIISGVFSNVGIEISVVIGGKEISLPNLLHQVVNQQLAKRGKEEVSFETFALTISKMGLPLVAIPEMNIRPEMTLMWQHFGPDEAKANAAFDTFISAGAEDVLAAITDPRRIKRAYSLPDGVPVTSIEIGRQDRGRNQYYGMKISGTNERFEGAGFLDILDAVFTNFMRSFTLRQERSVLKVELSKQMALPKPNEAKVSEINNTIKLIQAMTTSWMSNWGGAQRRVVAQPGDEISFDDRYDPVSAPVGRFNLVQGRTYKSVTDEAGAVEVVIDQPGDTIEVDLWKPRQTDGASTPGVSATSVPVNTTDEKDPF